MITSQKDDYQDKKNMTREEIIKYHMNEMEKRRKQEECELIQYLKEEDPESCINVLFVLHLPNIKKQTRLELVILSLLLFLIKQLYLI